jgi:hypothetical protein
MKAIKCWIQDQSKPPTVKIGILSAQNDVHRAIETQTEIGWLHMFSWLCKHRLATYQYGSGPCSKSSQKHACTYGSVLKGYQELTIT